MFSDFDPIGPQNMQTPVIIIRVSLYRFYNHIYSKNKHVHVGYFGELTGSRGSTVDYWQAVTREMAKCRSLAKKKLRQTVYMQ